MAGSEEAKRQMAFWKQTLAGELPPLSVPTDKPRPAILGHRGGSVEVKLGREVVNGLRGLGRACGGSTLFATTLALYQLMLCRLARQEEVIVGIPFHGRTRPGLEGLIGYFIKVLPVRTTVAASDTLKTLLERVRTTVLGCMSNADVPFPLITRQIEGAAASTLRDPSRSSPIFQTFFTLQTFALTELKLEGMKCETMEGIDGVEGTAKFELSLDLSENRTDGMISGKLEFNMELFEQETAMNFARAFESLCAEAATRVGATDTAVMTVPMIGEKEKKVVLEEWSGTKTAWAPLPEQQPQPQLLHELFEKQVEKTPESIALSFGEDEQKCPKWTYSEVNTLAEEVAMELKELGVGPDVVVGVCTGHRPEYIWSILGVLKAGGAFMPIGTSLPGARITELLTRAKCSIVIVSREASNPALETVGGATLIQCPLTKISDKLHSSSVKSQGQGHETKVTALGKVNSMNLAYVIPTSGSTGTPKLVAIPHEAISSLITIYSSKLFHSLSRTLLSTSFLFDVSVQDIFSCLSIGGYLALPSCLLSDGPTLLRTIQSHSLSHMSLTPSLNGFIVLSGFESSATMSGRVRVGHLCVDMM